MTVTRKELAGLWAMEPSELQALVARIEAAGPGGPDPIEAPRALDVKDGVARIAVRGPVVPHAPWWAELLGLEVASVSRISRELAAAVADPGVSSIALLVDSPGGMVAGVDGLASEIRAAGARKPIHASVGNMAASAAYWLAAQAHEISAPRTATVGSIGVVGVQVDSSKAAEAAGLRVHVIRSGPHKGLGVPGAPISDEQLAAMQEQIDQHAGIFIDSVAGGRRLAPEAVRRLATGRAWIAASAVELGLIDHIEGSAAALGRATGKGRLAMDEIASLKAQLATATAEAAKVPTLQALVESLRGEIETRDKGELTGVVERLNAHAQAVGPTPQLAGKIDRVKRWWSKDREEARALAQEILGEAPAVHGSVVPRPRDDRKKDFMSEVERIAQERKVTRGEAVVVLAREFPELYAELVGPLSTKAEG